MKSCSALIITVLLSILLWDSGQANAQCQQRLASDNVVIDKSANEGSFELKIIASANYNGQLIQLLGPDESLITSFSGSGTKEFNFKNLSLGEDGLFRVIVEFEGEDSFLCKKKMLDVEFTNR